MFADSYLKAADFLANGCKLRFNTPIYFLYAHAVELAFKAFLRSTGLTADQLKYRYGHGLTSLMGACSTKRPSVARRGADRAVVEWLEKGMNFRYISTGYYKNAPSLKAVSAVTTRLVKATKAACVLPGAMNYKSRGGNL
jgi:hypothetical protein